MFGDAVSTRVVPRYPDVSDVVLLFQVGKCFNKRRPIVSDDLAKSTPSAQDVFEDPISDGLHCGGNGIWGNAPGSSGLV